MPGLLIGKILLILLFDESRFSSDKGGFADLIIMAGLKLIAGLKNDWEKGDENEEEFLEQDFIFGNGTYIMLEYGNFWCPGRL